MRRQTARDQRRKRGMKRETNEGWDKEKAGNGGKERRLIIDVDKEEDEDREGGMKGEG